MARRRSEFGRYCWGPNEEAHGLWLIDERDDCFTCMSRLVSYQLWLMQVLASDPQFLILDFQIKRPFRDIFLSGFLLFRVCYDSMG